MKKNFRFASTHRRTRGQEHSLPFYCFKAVSDNLDGSLKDWRGILHRIREQYVSLLKTL